MCNFFSYPKERLRILFVFERTRSQCNKMFSIDYLVFVMIQ